MIDIIATILSICGAVLNAQHRIFGFYIWIVANTTWIIYGYMTGQIYLCITFLVYNIISVYGIYKWRKDEI